MIWITEHEGAGPPAWNWPGMRIRLAFLVALFLLLPLRAETSYLDFEKQIMKLTNQERARQKLPPYKLVEKLADCARAHSLEMAELKYFSHTSPTDGLETKRDRVKAVGLNPALIAENIYMSEGITPEQAVQKAMKAWMKSPGHRANILSAQYTQIGVGLVVSGKQIYVTQVFSTDTE